MDTFSMQSSGAINLQPLRVNKIALLDADYLKYVFCSRMQKKLDGTNYLHTDRSLVFDEVSDNVLYEVLEKINDPILFCFSGKSYNTFRYHLAVEKEYKGNRKKEELYEGADNDSHNFMEKVIHKYNTLLFNDLEADDIVSVLQDNNNTYIVSKDKDLMQIPGFHYDWIKNQIYEVTNEQAMSHLAKQLIMGDSTDAISGIDGMGPKRTEEFIMSLGPDVKKYIPAILDLYCKKYGLFEGTDRFSEVVQLIKMRRDRGEWFRRKYMKMYDMKKNLLLELERRKIA